MYVRLNQAIQPGICLGRFQFPTGPQIPTCLKLVGTAGRAGEPKTRLMRAEGRTRCRAEERSGKTSATRG